MEKIRSFICSQHADPSTSADRFWHEKNNLENVYNSSLINEHDETICPISMELLLFGEDAIAPEKTAICMVDGHLYDFDQLKKGHKTQWHQPITREKILPTDILRLDQLIGPNVDDMKFINRLPTCLTTRKVFYSPSQKQPDQHSNLNNHPQAGTVASTTIKRLSSQASAFQA